MPEPAPLATAPDPSAIARRIDRPLVLVGLMGAGKSTVGRRLAATLGYGFVDADEAIEQAAQISVSEIFETYGEAYFRSGERRVIARLIDEAGAGPGTVIATGGGAFVDPATRALILERAIAIWLDGDLDTLVQRVSRRATRPLLSQGDPREVLARLKAEREPAYAQAPIRIPSQPGPHQRMVAAILRELEAWR
ncbi:MAG: shikimate kinase [Novosphingobium sp.]|nr:shikimate kinase [Novosphingobium sp.]